MLTTAYASGAAWNDTFWDNARFNELLVDTTFRRKRCNAKSTRGHELASRKTQAHHSPSSMSSSSCMSE